MLRSALPRRVTHGKSKQNQISNVSVFSHFGCIKFHIMTFFLTICFKTLGVFSSPRLDDVIVVYC